MINKLILLLLPIYILEWFGVPPEQDWKPMKPEYKNSVVKLDTIHSMKNLYGVGYLSALEGMYFIENEKVLLIKGGAEKTVVENKLFGDANFLLKCYSSDWMTSKLETNAIKSLRDLDFAFNNQQEKEFFLIQGKVKSAKIIIPGKINDEKEHNWQEHISAGTSGDILAQIVNIYCFKIRYKTELRYFYFLKLKHGKLGGELVDFKPGKNMKIIRPVIR